MLRASHGQHAVVDADHLSLEGTRRRREGLVVPERVLAGGKAEGGEMRTVGLGQSLEKGLAIPPEQAVHDPFMHRAGLAEAMEPRIGVVLIAPTREGVVGAAQVEQLPDPASIQASHVGHWLLLLYRAM
jgi:hypothetical protein